MNSEGVEVIHWPDEKAPDEGQMRKKLADEDLSPYVWSNGPGDVYGAHSHPYHKVIYVVRGTITFELPESGREITIETGDRLELPPGVRHAAVVGSHGVVCLEAHR